jgi:hypothetical protein
MYTYKVTGRGRVCVSTELWRGGAADMRIGIAIYASLRDFFKGSVRRLRC